MQTITAKILDPTHLELNQPIAARPGEFINVYVAIPGESNEGEQTWKEAAKKHLLEAYADEDAIYDDL